MDVTTKSGKILLESVPTSIEQEKDVNSESRDGVDNKVGQEVFVDS